MAEISQSSGQSKAFEKVRTKKQSTKIDMTPMVDLAFLLLTFFILTSTFQNLRLMSVDMPDKTMNDPTPISVNNVLNLVIAENNKIYWWNGLTPPVKVTDFSKDGVRKVLLESGKANPKLIVLIKPKDESKYENIVDILDEMQITKMEKYAIVDFTEDDKNVILESGTIK
jgi:biopolymer transport protein ExbD